MQIQTGRSAARELVLLMNDNQLAYLISIWDQKHGESFTKDKKYIEQKSIQNRILRFFENNLVLFLMTLWICTVMVLTWNGYAKFDGTLGLAQLFVIFIVEFILIWKIWVKVEFKTQHFADVEQRIRNRLEMIKYLMTLTSFRGVRCTYTDIAVLFCDRVYEKVCSEKNGDIAESEHLTEGIRHLNSKLASWGIVDGNLKPFFAKAEMKWAIAAARGEILTDFQI